MQQSPQEQLLENLSKVVREFEDLVHATADSASSEREEAVRSMRSVKRQIVSSAGEQWRNARRLAGNTDTYVHNRAWQATGVALLAGIVVGMLIKPDRD